MMKVILTKDVKGTGKSGQIVEVSDGYASNFLIPKGMAKPATSGTIVAAKQKLEAEAHKKANEAADAKKRAAALDGKRVVLKARAGENAKLFGAITNKEIAEAIKAQLGADVDKKKVEVETIKHLGEYEVILRVYADTTAKITAEVVSE